MPRFAGVDVVAVGVDIETDTTGVVVEVVVKCGEPSDFRLRVLIGDLTALLADTGAAVIAAEHTIVVLRAALGFAERFIPRREVISINPVGNKPST